MAIWDRDYNPLFYDPWRELNRLRSRFRQLVESFPGERAVEFPAINVYANNDRAIVTAEIPGVEAEGLDINVKDRTLTIRGERRPYQPSENERYLRQERGFGPFVRMVQLPYAVEPDKVEATYKNGVLVIEAERAEAEKPKQISVKSG